MSLVRFAFSMTTALAISSPIHAQVKQVATYHTHEPPDRNVLFAIAVTPDNEVLSLVAKKDGKWRLTRIRNWWDKHPTDETIDVPGIAPSGKLQLLSASVLATADGNFAISIASGFTGKEGDVGGTPEQVVSVIDLHEFAVKNSARQTGILEYFTDGLGRLVAEQTDYGSKRTPVIRGEPGVHRTVTLAFFSIPNLSKTAACHFSETLSGASWIPRDEDCGPSLQSLLDGLRPRHSQTLPTGPPCHAGESTPDGLYRIETCNDFHRNFWGNPVVTDLRENVYSVSTGALLGAVKETVHDTVSSGLAQHDGNDYLLVMEGGTRLKVYEIILRSRPLTSSNAPANSEPP